MAKSITAHHLLSLTSMVSEQGEKAQLPQLARRPSAPAECVRDQLGEDTAEGEGLDDAAGPDGLVLGAGLEPDGASDWAG